MSEPQLDYRKIRRLADERLTSEKFRTRISFFAASLFAFILFEVISWALFLSRDGSSSGNGAVVGALVLLTISGMLGLLGQGMSIMLDTKAGERQLREKVYGSVMNEELMRLGEEDDSLSEKAKHMTRLTDDGELEEVAEDERQYEFEQQVKGLRKS